MSKEIEIEWDWQNNYENYGNKETAFALHKLVSSWSCMKCAYIWYVFFIIFFEKPFSKANLNSEIECLIIARKNICKLNILNSFCSPYAVTNKKRKIWPENRTITIECICDGQTLNLHFYKKKKSVKNLFQRIWQTVGIAERKPFFRFQWQFALLIHASE